MGTLVYRKFNYLAWTIFFIFVHMTASLPGITIPGIGSLYPLRLCLPFMVVFVLANERSYGKYRMQFLDLCIMFAIMLVYALFSLLWAYDVVVGIKQLTNLLFCFMLAIVVMRNIRSRRDFENMIVINMYILFAVMFLGIVESILDVHLFAPEWNKLYPNYPLKLAYPVVFYGNPNDMIFVLFLFMPFIMAVTKNRYTVQNGGYKYGLFLRILYVLLYIILSYLASCRMGMLLIPVAVYVNILLLKDKRPAMIVTTALLIGIVALLAIDAQNVLAIANKAMGPRLIIWANILKNAKYYYFMGTGIGNCYFPIEGIEYIENYISNPHNFFLEIFAEYGIIVFIMFMIWFINVIRSNCKTYKNCNDVRLKRIKKASLKFFLYFILTCVMCSSITALVQFWLVIAFILASIDLTENDTGLMLKE